MLIIYFITGKNYKMFLIIDLSLIGKFYGGSELLDPFTFYICILRLNI